MIERRTKVQLLVFVIITLVGVSFVGARYARLDRLVIDDTYTVVAHFSDSGGIFAGGEVTYRGVKVGLVDEMVLTDEGVDLRLSIDKDYDSIPADAIALVGNRSAVGEQYVELQPQSDEQPYLEEDSEIAVENTRTPIQTQTLLANLSDTVQSVDQDALRTTVEELGLAFAGTGEDLQRIIDTGNAFIEDANANFDVTTALIRDSNVVLRGQAAKASAIRNFAKNLALFSGTLADSDANLRQIIDERLDDRQRPAPLHRGQRGRPRRAPQQPRHHQRGRRAAPRRHRAGAGRLPLRRGGRLHRRVEVRHRALRRPLRHGRSRRTRRSAPGATRAPTADRPRTAATSR